MIPIQDMLAGRPILRLIVGFILILQVISCEKIVQVDPPVTSLPRAEVFETDATAIGAIAQLYVQLSNGIGAGDAKSVSYLNSLSSDDLSYDGNDFETRQFSMNELLSNNATILSLWTQAYFGIFTANAAIAGLENTDKINPSLKKQLMGEAKFFRAFYHFYLVNLFGKIAYISSTDFESNGLAERISVDTVYEKIVADLLAAKSGLSEDYSYFGNERIRVNKWAASALLARVYLYQKNWQRAEEQATTVITRTSLYKLNKDLNKVFFKNSAEAIWQLLPTLNQNYIPEGGMFNQDYQATIPVLSDGFMSSFEMGDARKENWVLSGVKEGHLWSHPLKYKSTYKDSIQTEYYMVLRLAEQYLIRAEARAQQNKLTGINGAAGDIDSIRLRAGLPGINTAATKDEMLNAIAKERRMELFVEWGHRWLDLKRTGKAKEVLSLVKTNWQDNDTIYPIPYKELQLNPRLKQNSGY